MWSTYLSHPYDLFAKRTTIVRHTANNCNMLRENRVLRKHCLQARAR